MFELLDTVMKYESSIVRKAALLRLLIVAWARITATAVKDTSAPIARANVMILSKHLRHMLASNWPNRAATALRWVHCLLLMLVFVEQLEVSSTGRMSTHDINCWWLWWKMIDTDMPLNSDIIWKISDLSVSWKCDYLRIVLLEFRRVLRMHRSLWINLAQIVAIARLALHLLTLYHGLLLLLLRLLVVDDHLRR